MPLVGVVARSKDVKAIKKEVKEKNIEIVGITKDSIKNIKNIKFDEIIFLENLEIKQEEYVYMKEMIINAKFLILNGDVQTDILKEIDIEKPIKLITFGFNSKSTITISSVSEEKIIVYIQREIEKGNGEILETQEQEILCKNKKIYNNLVVFIINVLHNA